MRPQALTVSAPAKVNLYLAVGSRRPDGYHHVDTVLQTVSLSDRVFIEPSDSLELVVTGRELDVPAQENLAWKAAEAMAAELGVAPGVRITLEKRIPAGGGLGGGSSDAAAVLAGTAALWDASIGEDALMRIAARLGADVAFFLTGGTAYFTGRGDRLVRRLPTVEMPLVLIKPAPPIETRAAYAEFDRSPAQPGPGVSGIADACRSNDPVRVARSLFNNMTPAAERLVPEVSDALALCDASRAVLGALVAGSGSSVFGICDDDGAAESVAAEARERGWWAQPAATTPGGVEVVVAKEVT